MSYLQQRLKEMNITQKDNTFTATNIEHTNQRFSFFSEDADGNIIISYLSPDGFIEYYTPDNKKFLPFNRIRYKSPDDNKRKYKQAFGTEVIPFSTPRIIESFQKKEKVKTLYITEGEFKSFSLSKEGIHCMGIGGIHNFKNKDKDKLHQYIIDFIKTCQVENIVLLFDADCLKVEWKENEDLTTRLKQFHSAVSTFNELLKPFDVTMYFAHIDVNSEHKGIDDLLNAVKNKKDVLDELTSFTSGSENRKYIHTYKVSGVSPYNIKRIFGLDSVQTFFEKNFSLLQDKEFIYYKDPYYCDANGKLSVSWKGEQNNYIRIGTDYFKKVIETSPNKQTEINLKRWTITTIKADYNKSNIFINKIQKCDSFTNIPENDPKEYKQIVHSEKNGIKSVLYNRYELVSHIPSEGDWSNIDNLLHHIFDYQNCSGEPLYEFALDYLQILYKSPVTKLPVLCLVSKENGTGKTTFLEFLRAIYVENMRILDSDRISSKFNGSWAGKLVVAIDESLIAMDKDTVKNRIKMIATNKTIPLEEKGLEAREIPNFAKLIMCSNDENNFMRIDQEENRYCIIKVPAIPLDKRDNKLYDKMIKEIPAFLYFLKNRKLHYPDVSRLYFDERIYTTPALKKVKERTEAPLIKHIKDVIRGQFEKSNTDYVRLSLKALYDLVKLQYAYADRLKIQEWLNDNNYKTSSASNIEYYLPDNDEPIKTKAKYYEFEINNFFSEEELADLLVNG
ncbi:MAG: DUF3854 domain-containing protein [Bacteroidales bacterium]|nr:DUF3854 domain-containing protein [Bacteroidales bacterium]